MAIQLQGNGGVVAEVDANTRALYTNARPIDVGSLGSYAVLVSTGTMAAGLGASAPVFSFRWGDATRTCLVRRVTVAMMSLGTGFTAGVGFFDMMVARSFTASDTGGTAVTLTGNNQKRRTSFGTALVTDMRISSTATLTAGTRTLDTYAVAGVRYGVTATTNAVMLATTGIWSPDWSGEWPLVLVQNEGFILRATVPATGTWQGDVSVEWTEVSSF